jgi:CysZ protein
VLQDLQHAIAYEVKKVLITVGLGIPLLLVSFLPGIGTLLATIGSTTLAVTWVCLDCLDPAQERRRLCFRDKVYTIVKTFPASGSFGLACFVLVSVPLLNLLAIPICVTAGTLLFCDHHAG